MRPAIRICMIQNRWRPHFYLLHARPVGFLPHVKVVIRDVGPCLIRRRDTSQSALRLVLSDRMYQLTPTATASMAARSHHEPNISTMQCSEVSHNSDNEIIFARSGMLRSSRKLRMYGPRCLCPSSHR